MKLLTFKEDGQLKLGVKTGTDVLHVEKASVAFNIKVPKSMEEVIGGEGKFKALEKLTAQAIEESDKQLFLQEDDLDYGPCVPKPGKMICVGLNYKKHADESNMPYPEFPILFNKFDNTVAAHQQAIKLPFNSKENDYEAELSIVIGKEAKRVLKEDALDYVFGYCTSNDLSSRDLQFRTNQWLLGKCCDGFSPMGPYLVTSEEVGDPNALKIQAFLNGEKRQDSNTSDMIFNCREIISYISDHMTLSPGDVIFTGTPEGVILGMPEEEREYLKEGDEVTIEIEKLGSLTNTFEKEV